MTTPSDPPATDDDRAALDSQRPPVDVAAESRSIGSGTVRRYLRPVAYVVVAGVLLWIGIEIGSPSDDSASERSPVAAEDGSHADHGADTIWTCSMHPQIRMQEPGKCPICGMDLIPVEAGPDIGGDTGERIVLSDRAKRLAKVRTEVVEPAGTAVTVRLLGRLEADEQSQRIIAPWTSGRIDRLFVSNTGARVTKGQVVASLYSPEIYSAHQDLLAAKRQVERLKGASSIAKQSSASALEASRERLRLLGIPPRDLTAMEGAERPWQQIKIRTPYAGTVTDLSVTEGAYVQAGTPIYRTADLSNIWVQLDAYESDIGKIKKGREVDLQVDSFPGEEFKGKVSFVDPVVDPKLRTARVRVEVPNKDGRLRPGMFARAVVHAPAEVADDQRLVIPATAPLFTGTRSVVYVEVPAEKGTGYEVREVTLGPRAGEVYPVLSGLEKGERVVVQGVFAIDSDLQIRGGRSMMTRQDDVEREARNRPSVGPAFQRGLAPTIDAYLDVQEKLATDDLPGAIEAFHRIETEAKAFRPAEKRDVWKNAAAHIVSAAQQGGQAESLTRARASFLHLSGAVIKLLAEVGNPLEDTVNIDFCPMADDGKGAQWLQRRGDLANPYFGAAMLSCGEVQSPLGQGARPAPAGVSPEKTLPPAAAPGGHQH